MPNLLEGVTELIKPQRKQRLNGGNGDDYRLFTNSVNSVNTLLTLW